MAAGHAFPHLADEEDRKNSEKLRVFPQVICCGSARQRRISDHGTLGLTEPDGTLLAPTTVIAISVGEHAVGDTRDALRRAP